MNDNDLTSVEREALEALPKERTPSPFLEERVVKALRDGRLLRPDNGRAMEITRGRIAVAAAAAIVLLLGGFVLGRWTNEQPATPADAPATQASELSLAASLQRAGTAYVSALEELASSEVSPHSDEMRQGREVALTTLYSAAGEVTRIVPKNHLAGQFLRALDVTVESRPAERDSEQSERVIWF